MQNVEEKHAQAAETPLTTADRPMRYLVIASFMLALVGCAPSTVRFGPSEANATPLALRVSGIDDSLVVTFDAMNTSSGAILVTPAFGFDFYFHLEIQAEDGTPVHLLAWELTREISGRCLRVGEKLSFRVPLGRWSAVMGTDASCADQPCNTVQLPAGSYRVRATYRPVQKNALRGRCDSVSRVVTSDWVQFEVREPHT